MLKLQDWVGLEIERNKRHADLYEQLVKRAFGADMDVLVGHHIVIERHGDIKSETEIPSADTLLFNIEIMTTVFGEELAQTIIHTLCEAPPDEREAIVGRWLDAIDNADEKEQCRSTHLNEVA